MIRSAGNLVVQIRDQTLQDIPYPYELSLRTTTAKFIFARVRSFDEIDLAIQAELGEPGFMLEHEWIVD
jgi:hypothetical protein